MIVRWWDHLDPDGDRLWQGVARGVNGDDEADEMATVTVTDARSVDGERTAPGAITVFVDELER